MIPRKEFGWEIPYTQYPGKRTVKKISETDTCIYFLAVLIASILLTTRRISLIRLLECFFNNAGSHVTYPLFHRYVGITSLPHVAAGASGV